MKNRTVELTPSPVGSRGATRANCGRTLDLPRPTGRIDVDKPVHRPGRPRSLKIVFLGLSITSSWGNGHATTYRGLIRELIERGHCTHFLERDVEWYARNRDLPEPPYGETSLYRSLDELKSTFAGVVKSADLVVVGSYVPDGVDVGEWVTSIRRGPTAFYDIDTPVTLAKLEAGDFEYLHPSLIPKYDLYLSFAGGPTLGRLECKYGSPMARPFYCSFDPEMYFPEPHETKWDLGYMGTYSDDRQPGVDRLLSEPARLWPEGRFAVAGPMYPPSITWPSNVERIEHLPPCRHRAFYNSQRFTLNITRADMIRAGYSPSVRLFEAAACAVPIISDYWDGLETFFDIGGEILTAMSTDEAMGCLRSIPEPERRRIGARAHERVMSAHTAAHRAAELEAYALEVLSK